MKKLILLAVVMAFMGCATEVKHKTIPKNYLSLSEETMIELYRNAYLRGYIASQNNLDVDTAFKADTSYLNIVILKLKLQ